MHVVCIGCSFCRLIIRPEHLTDRHRYLPANWRSFIRWSPDQWVSQCYSIECSVLCLYDSCESMSNQPARWTPYIIKFVIVKKTRSWDSDWSWKKNSVLRFWLICAFSPPLNVMKWFCGMSSISLFVTDVRLASKWTGGRLLLVLGECGHCSLKIWAFQVPPHKNKSDFLENCLNDCDKILGVCGGRLPK
jgi:hypothetical protein